jgi:hypothetical protein
LRFVIHHCISNFHIFSSKTRADGNIGTTILTPASKFVTGIVLPLDGGFSVYSGVLIVRKNHF